MTPESIDDLDRRFIRVLAAICDVTEVTRLRDRYNAAGRAPAPRARILVEAERAWERAWEREQAASTASCYTCERPVPSDTDPEIVRWEFGDDRARCPQCVKGDPYRWDDDEPWPGARDRDLASVGDDPHRRRAEPLRLTPEQKRARDAFAGTSARDARRDEFASAEVFSEPGAAYEVVETGRTGAPTGRPRLGTDDPEQAAQLLQDHDDGRRTIEQMRGLIGPGKRADAQLARAVAAITEARRATDQALAAALDCNRSTVHRLAARGNATKDR
jgi:hypothetical protein